MPYESITTLISLKKHLISAVILAFDFETAPDEEYRNEEKSALDAHKSIITGISFSVAEGSAVYLPLSHHTGQNAEEQEIIWDWLKTEIWSVII